MACRNEGPVDTRPSITQLAIATGTPRFAQHYFERIEQGLTEATESTDDKGEHGENPENLGALVQRALPEGTPGTPRDWLYVYRALDQFQQQAGREADPNTLIAELRKWAPVARRYSFAARPH